MTEHWDRFGSTPRADMEAMIAAMEHHSVTIAEWLADLRERFGLLPDASLLSLFDPTDPHAHAAFRGFMELGDDAHT